MDINKCKGKMKGKKGQSAILTLSLTIIIVMVILGVVFTFLNTSSLNTATNLAAPVSVTHSAGVYSGALSEIGNGRGVVLNAFYNATVTGTVGTNVNSTSAGVLTLGNSTFNGVATYYANYTYQPVGYVESSTTRMVLAMLPVLLALVVLIFAAGYIGMKQ